MPRKTIDDLTAAELRQVMANATRLGNKPVYWQALNRLCRISGQGDPDPLVRECESGLVLYEELLTQKNGRTTKAARSRQKIAAKGLIQCMEDWARQKTSYGLEMLVSNGMVELTAEYLVLKYSDRFSPEAIAASKSKLRNLGYSFQGSEMASAQEGVPCPYGVDEKHCGGLSASLWSNARTTLRSSCGKLASTPT